jgi:hypothetical protein
MSPSPNITEMKTVLFLLITQFMVLALALAAPPARAWDHVDAQVVYAKAVCDSRIVTAWNPERADRPLAVLECDPKARPVCRTLGPKTIYSGEEIARILRQATAKAQALAKAGDSARLFEALIFFAQLSDGRPSDRPALAGRPAPDFLDGGSESETQARLQWLKSVLDPDSRAHATVFCPAAGHDTLVQLVSAALSAQADPKPPVATDAEVKHGCRLLAP